MTWIDERHYICNGEVEIFRAKQSGLVWQFRMWIPETQKAIRKSLREKDFDKAEEKAIIKYQEIQSERNVGDCAFGNAFKVKFLFADKLAYMPCFTKGLPNNSAYVYAIFPNTANDTFPDSMSMDFFAKSCTSLDRGKIGQSTNISKRLDDYRRAWANYTIQSHKRGFGWMQDALQDGECWNVAVWQIPNAHKNERHLLEQQLLYNCEHKPIGNRSELYQ